MKEFVTSAREAEDAEDAVLGKTLTVKVDDREVKILPATQGQIAMLLAGTSDTVSQAQSVATSINFFFSLLEKDSDVRYFKTRLLDRNDDLEADMIEEVVEYLIEEWTARPTKQPSDFRSSQPSTGENSTAKRRHKAASTR